MVPSGVNRGYGHLTGARGSASKEAHHRARKVVLAIGGGPQHYSPWTVAQGGWLPTEQAIQEAEPRSHARSYLQHCAAHGEQLCLTLWGGDATGAPRPGGGSLGPAWGCPAQSPVKTLDGHIQLPFFTPIFLNPSGISQNLLNNTCVAFPARFSY